jgi:hypothetical protein
MTLARYKTPILALLLLFTIAAASFAYRFHMRRLQAQQTERDAGYRVMLAQYQRDLHAGMTRATVTAYLESHNIGYGDAFIHGSGNAWSYEIRIGTDPSHMIVCKNWEVYIALDFDSPTSRATIPEHETGDPSDILKDIRIYKFCW